MSRMPPSQAIDARVKNRSRMAYTLAEMEVKLVDPQAQGIILDIHGNVGRTREATSSSSATANCGPRRRRTAWPESVGRRSWSWRGSWAFRRGRRSFSRTISTRPMSSSSRAPPYCIMPATRFNGLAVGNGEVGAVTRQLLSAWSELVGVDIAKQAKEQLN